MTTTKPKTFIPRPAQLAAIHRGAGLIVVPMKPQPSAGFLARRVVGSAPDGNGVRWFMADGMSELVPCPFPPGCRVAVKEAWAQVDDKYGAPLICYSDGTAQYHGMMEDDRDELCGFADGGYEQPRKWNSAATLPLWAVRTFLAVEAVECRQVQTITEAEAQLAGVRLLHIEGSELDRYCGHRYYFQNNWDTLYGHRFNGKGRKKRNGPLGQFAWESNPWCWFYTVKREDAT